MSNIVTLSIPLETIRRAKELNLNCSQLAREAISSAVLEKERKIKGE